MRAHALLVIGDEALQIADAQRLHFLRQQALPFALIFLRTNPPRHCGQHIRFADLCRRAQEIADYDLLHEIFHVNPDGTVVGASWLRAFQAAQCLLLSQFSPVAQVHLFEIMGARLGRLFRHELPRNLDALFWRQRILRFAGCRAHRRAPGAPKKGATHACSSTSCLCLNSVIDRCSASRYIEFRCTSTAKSTLCPSNSGPSTQANSLLPSMSTRQPPHMPVPSIMIGFKLTTVWMFSLRVISATAFIITIGPTAMTRSIRVPFSINCRSLSVTKPLSA